MVFKDGYILSWKRLQKRGIKNGDFKLTDGGNLDLESKGYDGMISNERVIDMAPADTTPKKRYILLGLWLGLILVRNGVGSFFYLTHHPALHASFPQVPALIWTAFGFLGIGTVICCFALFMRRRWGFWGVCVTSVLSAITHVAYGTGWILFIEPCSVLILFGLLKVGKNRSAWQHLRQARINNWTLLNVSP